MITTTDAPLTFGEIEGVMSGILYGLTFEECTSTSPGGAIVAGTTGDNCVRIVNCTFNRCSSSEGHGGAIYFSSSYTKSMRNSCGDRPLTEFLWGQTPDEFLRGQTLEGAQQEEAPIVEEAQEFGGNVNWFHPIIIP